MYETGSGRNNRLLSIKNPHRKICFITYILKLELFTISQCSRHLNLSIFQCVSLVYKFLLHKIMTAGYVSSISRNFEVNHRHRRAAARRKWSERGKSLGTKYTQELKNFWFNSNGKFLIILLTAWARDRIVFISSLTWRSGLCRSTSIKMTNFKMLWKVGYVPRRPNFMQKKFIN